MVKLKDIKQLGRELTGLKVKVSNKRQTAFVIKYEEYTVVDAFINLNLKQVDKISMNELDSRGYSKEYLLLKALLHEVCHYKQYKRVKLNEWLTFSCKIQRHREDVADRYALRYYKKFVRK